MRTTKLICLIKYFGLVFFGVPLIVSSCKTKSTICFRLIDYCSFDKYSSENISFENEILVNSPNSIPFYFSNNPFCLDSSYSIKIYLNNKLSYKGNYQYTGKLFLPNNLKEEDPVHFRLLIKSARDELVFSLENKSVVAWKDSYSHLYIATFIGGIAEELIEFYPLSEPIVN